MKKFIVIFLLFIPFLVFSQEKNNDNELALLYFSRGEYNKAVELYEKLYYQSHAQIHFDYAVQCYVKLNMLSQAQEIIESQIKYFPKSYYYLVKLEEIYKLQNLSKEATNVHSKILKKSVKNEYDCLEAANAYIDNDFLTEALELLQVGVNKYPDNILFYKKIALVYQKKRDGDKLLKSYFDLLLKHPQELEYCEMQLQTILFETTNDDIKEKFKDQVLSIIDSKPDKSQFSELLLWFYIQEKNFNRAFVIAKSLDIINKEDGVRVFELGKLALSNSDFNIASDCFSYTIAKGVENNYYMHAMKLLLETAYTKLFVGVLPDKEKILNLENEYIKAIQSLGKTPETVDVIKNLAHIQTFYLGKSNDAILSLTEAMQIHGVAYIDRAELELELANIYLFVSDIWSANLLYAKIALEYKNNDIGHQARLKQAFIAYYNGQFDYAEALLDVLKASTSKLIANDAFELAQLITDNTILDTSTNALSLFSKADLYVYQNNDSLANLYLDSIVLKFPGHSLEDDILMRKAIIAKKQSKTLDMITYLTEITTRFSYDVFADNALFMLAEYYDYVELNKESAQKYYKSIIENHANSYYSTIARKRYRELEKL